MGYWLSYIDIGFTGTPRLFFDDAHVLLFSVPVVAATLLVPALGSRASSGRGAGATDPSSSPCAWSGCS